MLVASDMLTGKNFHAINKGKGDAFMIAGATLYGFSRWQSLLFGTSLNTIRSSKRHGGVFR